MNRGLKTRFGGAAELLCVANRKMRVDMKHLFRCLAFGLLLASFCVGPVLAQQVKAGELVIEGAWSRATPAGANVGAGYLVIKNGGTVADRLVGGTTDAARALEFHTMTVKDGMMTMEHIADGLLIEPGKSIAFTPGGYHIMLWTCTRRSSRATNSGAPVRERRQGGSDLSGFVHRVARPDRQSRFHTM